MLVIDFLIFLLFWLILIYPLGKIITNILRLNFSFWEDFLISTNVGIVVFASAIFLLWYFGLHKFTYLILLIPVCFLAFNFKRIANHVSSLKKNAQMDVILLVIILVTTFIQSIIAFQSGDLLSSGLRLVGANGRDGLNYLALVNVLQRGVPPENPAFSGELLKNYHYFTYIFISAINYLVGIPTMTLIFKIIIPFFTLLFSATTYILIKRLSGSKIAAYLGTLFVTISGNFYYVANLFYPDAANTPSVFWVDEYTTRMVNPQLIASYIIIFTLLNLLLTSKKLNELKFILVFSFLTGTLIAFKAFGSIIFLASLFVLALYKILKKEIAYLKIFIGSFIFSLFFYFASNPNFSSTVLISPFWFIKNIFETADHLNFPEWELKRQTYLAERNFLRVAQLYLEGSLVFLIGNLGGRVIGLISLLKMGSSLTAADKQSKTVLMLLGLISFFATIFTFTFLVRGTAWNSIQFFYYSLPTLSILAILYIYKIYLRKKIIGALLFLTIWISLLPGVFHISGRYFNNEREVISKNYYDASIFLSKQDDGAVLLHPKFYSNSFVTAISKKTAFFADEMWLMVQLVPFEKRKRETDQFFLKSPIVFSETFLFENRIQYIFTQSDDKMDNLKVRKIYSNSEISIYRFDQKLL